MKGDTFVCHASCYRIKCKTCYYEHVSIFNEMRDATILRTSSILEKRETHVIRVSRIRFPCPKILVHVLSLSHTTLSNFLKSPSALALLSSLTPLHRHCLPSPIPALKPTATSSLTLQLTASSSLASEHTTASSPISPIASSSTSASLLLQLCCRCQPLSLDTTTYPPDTGPSPRRRRLTTQLYPKGDYAPPPFSLFGLLT
jgi:hypothetical protein